MINAQISQLQVSLDAIIKAQEVYRLENGVYASDINDLTIEIKVPSNITCAVTSPWERCILYTLSPKKAIETLERYQPTGKKLCCAYKDTDWIAESHCMGLMGTTEKDSGASTHCYQ